MRRLLPLLILCVACEPAVPSAGVPPEPVPNCRLCGFEAPEEDRFLGQGVDGVYFLTDIPWPQTLGVQVVAEGVTYGFEAEDFGYDLVQNAVFFEAFVPEPTDEVRITYDRRDGT